MILFKHWRWSKLKDDYPEIAIKFEIAQYHKIQNVVPGETTECIVIDISFWESNSRAAHIWTLGISRARFITLGLVTSYSIHVKRTLSRESHFLRRSRDVM